MSRPWFVRDPLAARERLRHWLRTLLESGPGERDWVIDRRVRPELVPLEWRNPVSEAVFGAMLPLAVTASSLAEAVHLRGLEEALAAAPPGPDPLRPDRSAAPERPVGGGGGVERPRAAASAGRRPTASDEGIRRRILDEDPESGSTGGGLFAYGGGAADPWGDSRPAAGGEVGGGGVRSSGPAAGGGPGGGIETGGSPLLLIPGTGRSDPGAGGASDGDSAGAEDLVPGGTGTSAAAGGGRERGTPSFRGEWAGGPVRFVANDGQWDSAVDFAVRGDGYQAWFTPGAAVLALAREARPGESEVGSPVVSDVVRLDWLGPNDGVRGTGAGRLTSVSHFLLGTDRAQWRTNVAEYAAVRYAGAWDGVDVVYRRADARSLAYDVRVAAGADPDAVGLRIDGASAAVDDRGRLVLTTPTGNQLATSSPVLYQVRSDGSRQAVTGSYRVRADGTLGFAVGAYDRTRELVIDPTLVYTATLGGSSTDAARGVAVDTAGNAVLAGYTQSSNFPTTTGVYDTALGGGRDAFAAKFDASGSLVWSTYLGGDDAFGGDDEANGVALGPDGSVFVAGTTYSTNFPTTSGAFQTTPGTSFFNQDAFLTRLTSDGTALSYSTYVGGTAFEAGNAVAVDPATGEAVIVGYTLAGDFPTENADQSSRAAWQDAFVTRLTADGSAARFSTYLGGAYGIVGGEPTSGTNTATGVAIDAAGHAVVVGSTDTNNFPVREAYQPDYGGDGDAFLALYSPDGTRVSSTYYGGSGADAAAAVAVDDRDRVYVTGSGFTVRFDALRGSAPVYVIGAGGNGVAVDGEYRAIVVGTSGSSIATTRYESDGSGVDWSTTASGGAGAAAAADRDGFLYAAGGVTNAVLLKYGPPVTPVITGLTDDTGASNADRVTNDTTPTLSGTAPASSTVTVYRQGVNDPRPVSVGTTTASGGGLWSFTDSPALAGGVYGFTATATVSGETSLSSAPLTVTLDTVAPTVGLWSGGTQTYDVTPDLIVTASDLIGFASPVTATLDVDLNNDGDFADPGETGYAAAAFVNGAYASFDGYTALTPGATYRFQARVTDLAGNEGTSSTTTIQVQTSPTSWDATPGTSGSRSGYGGPTGGTTSGLLYAGDASTSHRLDLDRSTRPVGGESAYLVYHSQEANPAPSVQAFLQSDNALGLPSHVYGTLTWDGVAGSQIDYDLSGLSPGGQWVFAAAPTNSLGTGRHTYALSLFVDYVGSGNDHWVTVTGDTFVVNRSGSPYGAGWSFSNADTLVSVAAAGSYPAGVLRLYGNGGWAFYEDTGSGNYAEPEGDAGTLTFTGGVGWTYTAPDGDVSQFNTSGQMTSRTHAASQETVTYTYDGSGGVATVTHPDGGVATFAYSGGLLETITAPGSRVTTFAYTGTDLDTITNPDGGTHTFTYSAHRMTSESHGPVQTAYTYDSNGLTRTVRTGSDPVGTITAAMGIGLGAGADLVSGGVPGQFTIGSGAESQVSYNAFGQPVRSVSPVGGVTEITRDGNGFVTGYTDALDRTTTTTVDAAGRVTGRIRPDGSSASWTYGGANGSLTEHTDYNGGLWTYTNDATGNRLTVETPLNQTSTLTWESGLLKTVTDATGRVVTYSYDAQRRLIGSLLGGEVTGTVGYDAAGNATTFTDPLGNVTTSTFDERGRLTAVTDALGNTTTYVYDDAGFLLSVIDPLAHTTSYAYDSSGRVIGTIQGYGSPDESRATSVYDGIGQLIASVDPLGHRTTMVYDAAGRVVATVDALGHRTTSLYDLAGQLTAMMDPLGRVTELDYDLLGRRVTTTDPLARVTTTVYDDNSQVLATVDPLGHRMTSVYDEANRMIASVDPLGHRTTYNYDAANRMIAVTDPLGNTSTTVYDSRNRVEATIDALGNRVTFGYDAADNPITVTDPLNHTTTTVYDELNRAIATIDALGHRCTVVYDDAGRLIESIDPLGNTTTTVYDALNRAIATIDAQNHRWTTTYDAASNATGATDPLGNSTSAEYDALNRLIASFDAAGNGTLSTFDAAGQLIAVTDALGTTTQYAYDGAGRMVAVTDPLGNTWTTTYDAAGRAIASTDPEGHTSTTVYDDASRVIAAVDPLGNRTSYGYDAASNMVTLTDPRGSVTTSVYDSLNRAEATIDALNHRGTIVFDDVGRVIAAVDPLGNRTSYGYDAANRSITTTDALGNVWTTTYDAASNVIAQTDPLVHTTTTVYDEIHRVVASVDALGERTTWSYDAAGNLKTVTDALDRVTTYGYDARNLQVTQTDALGDVWTTQYDALGRAWRSVDPLGRDYRAYFDAAGRVVENADGLGFRWGAVYDDAGNAIVSVDPFGNRVTTVYDAADRPIATIDAVGNRTTTVYDEASNTVATIDARGNRGTSVYDVLNRVEATIDAQNHRSTVIFDAAGNTLATVDALDNRTSYGYDALNRAVTVTDALDGVSSTTYDAAGNVATTVDPLGRTTSYGYDAADRMITVTDALGNVGTTAYDAVGNAITHTDALNHTTTMVFDNVNRVIATVDPLGNRSTTVYDAAGQMIASVDPLAHATSYGYDARGLMRTTTDALGNVWTTTYDDAGNAIAQTNARGNTTTTTYDARNMAVAVEDALGNVWTTQYDAVGNVEVTIDPLGQRTTAVYDELNRQIATIDPLNHRTTVAYDEVGNVEATTDALNQTTTFGYDALYRRITTTDPLEFVTTSVFDAVGNRTALVDASNNITTWVYDALNRVSSETDPLSASSTMAYDDAGRLTSQTDRLGRRRDFGYDDAGRLVTEKWYAVGGALAQTQTWTYDAAGRMLTAQDPDGVYTLAYDNADRVTRVAEPFGLVLTFTLDEQGNRTRIDDSKNGVTTVAFDALDRQSSEQVGGSGVSEMRFDYAYTARGEVESLTRYSDLAGTSVVGTTAYDYDAAGRNSNIQHLDSTSTVLANYTYIYDAADRLAGKIENGTGTSFAYDVADQLTQDGAATFGYDATGNRTNTGYVTGAGNRISTDGVWTYTHDAEGNVTKKSQGASSDTWVYSYDHRNQMVSAAYSATDGGAVTERVTYAYDAWGNRIQREA